MGRPRSTEEHKAHMRMLARERNRRYRMKYKLTVKGIAAIRKGRSNYSTSPYGKEVAKLKRKRESVKIKMTVLKAYGGDPPKCACCGEDNIGFLTLDHVNNDGYKHKRRHGKPAESSIFAYRRLIREGFPNDPPLQVLCCNCNCGKQRNGGICPHRGLNDWAYMGWLRHVDGRGDGPKRQPTLFDNLE